MSLTVACVLRSGGVYTPEWVDRLARQARRFLGTDRIVCLSDQWREIEKLDDVQAPILMHNWPGWFSKIELFRPHLFSGPTLYVDLDSLILRPIADLEATIVRVNKLCLLDDFFAPKRPASGVMAWIPSPRTGAIYREFLARPRFGSGWSNGDGAIIGAYDHVRLQSLFPGAFQSWKVQQRKRQPVDGSILCFHGTPKNNDFPPEHWITRHWIGSDVAAPATQS